MWWSATPPKAAAWARTLTVTTCFCCKPTGNAAGALGDKWNLGFLAETERQVGAHLNRHLDQLPAADDKSRAILEQMKTDEAEHAATAIRLGGAELPNPVKAAMQGMSKVMTSTTYHL